MKNASLALALCAAAALAQSPGVASAANPPAGVVSSSQSGCVPSESRPNFAALPSGTRVFYMPVMTIRYAKPGVDVAEARFTAVNGQLQADIRNNAVYVNGKKTEATLSESTDTNIQARIQVCTYPPGQPVPANFTGITPDLVIR
ncbi:MAG TPA: hypothetical protein VHS78_02980 [Candidatus Elarobacter sp.]|nr:hypothetical protein [Candidatus Elarobacter sp.]